MDATHVELEAIQLRFRAQNPEAPADAKPTREQAEILLREIREREALVEQSALAMLHQATKNSPTYSGMRSKYMQLLAGLLLVSVVGVAALYLLVLLASWLLRIRL
jgi:hypothetical protein